MFLSDLEVDDLRWRKASRSINNGACVEVAPVSGQVVIRDSTDREGPMLRHSGRSWIVFVANVKTGLFDPDCL